MGALESESLDKTSRRMFTLFAWLSLATIIVLFVYGVNESWAHPGLPVGQVWVDVYWPFPPFFAQPVTYFSVACIALFYSGLRLGEERIARWPKPVHSFLQLFGFIVAFSSAYEVIYNFIFWGGTYVAAAIEQSITIPDLLVSNYPAPWSFVFATRAFAALFVISGYSVYFLRKMSKSRLI